MGEMLGLKITIPLTSYPRPRVRVPGVFGVRLSLGFLGSRTSITEVPWGGSMCPTYANPLSTSILPPPGRSMRPTCLILLAVPKPLPVVISSPLWPLLPLYQTYATCPIRAEMATTPTWNRLPRLDRCSRSREWNDEHIMPEVTGAGRNRA